MSLHSPLRSLLLSWSEVTSLLTLNPNSNDYPIRPERLHQTDKLPAIEIAIPNEDLENDLQGKQIASTSTIVISCISTDFAQAEAIATAILTRNTNPSTGLKGFQGTAGTINLDGCNVTNLARGYAKLPDGSDSGEYVVEIHVEIWTRFP